MKITPVELKKIIKEEAFRLKTIMILEAERDSILKKLHELEESEMVEEGLKDVFQKAGQALGIKTPEQKREETLKAILAHPVKSKMYNQEKAISSERGEAYIKYMSEHPNEKEGVAWDETQKGYIPLSDVGLSSRPLMQRLAAGSNSLTAGGGVGAPKK